MSETDVRIGQLYGQRSGTARPSLRDSRLQEMSRIALGVMPGHHAKHCARESRCAGIGDRDGDTSRVIGRARRPLCSAVIGGRRLPAPSPAPATPERDFLSRVRRLTVEGRRAGEGYWSPDGKRLVFQSEREPGNPFYQIYAVDLTTGDTVRISPGHGQDHVRVLPAGQRSDPVRVDAPRSEVEAVPGRGARVPRLRQGAPLRVGLRPGDGDLRGLARRPERSEAADQRARLRRRGQLLARRPVDRVLVDARRLQPHADRRGEEAARGRSRASSARSTSCAPTAPARSG